jgi:formate dehydrogenase alpha subunit
MRRKRTEPYTRLTRPLVRDGGRLRPASWEEALDRAAEGFRRNVDAHGPDSFGLLSCARATNEMNYVAQKFARVVIGTNNVDSCNRTCHAPSVAGLAAAFDSGGGTSSYEEIEHTDVIVMWGSNAREAHPIFFQHVLKGVRNGAKLFVVDPRRTVSAAWGDRWLPLEVGTDIPLASAVAREIIHAGLANTAFIEKATERYQEFAAAVEPWTMEAAERETGVPADLIRELAHAYARADRAQLVWTLGITEHHVGSENVMALINLALLTGHVGRYGSGLSPMRGQNNVQGGGDMGAIPNRLPGFQDISSADVRAKYQRAWGVRIRPEYGLTLTQMCQAMDDCQLRTVYAIGENPMQSEPDTVQMLKRLSNLDHFVVQDMFLTRTAQLADVVLPAAASWCETEGTFINSERRVQRVRKALEPPQGARDDIDILCELARRLGRSWHYESSEQVWDEMRSLAPVFAGISYRRLEELRGVQWPCYSEDTLEPPYLHHRLWEDDPAKRGRLAPFQITPHRPPADQLSPQFPIRLTTGRRLDSYNTGVQSGGFASPLRYSECVDVSPEDATALGVEEEELVRITSRRASVVAPIRIDIGLRAGLAFMSYHDPDLVDTNALTIEATCPIAGTAEYKATAICIEKLSAGERAAHQPAFDTGTALTVSAR